MCDTFYFNNSSTAFFGKNSDRSCNEPNLTLFIAAAEHQEPMLQATYITVPQVKRTNALILVKPSWMFGGEMGISSKGVCIGNEAVFTKNRGKKRESLIGMDYLRIALERGDNAQHCLQIIIDLLQVYSQGGNCGYDKPFYYDNSYLIADATSAFILETVGKKYKVQAIGTSGNISNRLTIGEDNFAAKHSEPLFTHFSGSYRRQTRLGQDIAEASTLAQACDSLGSHVCDNYSALFNKGSVSSVCMHQSALGDHTTASMVYNFNSNVVWLTGCSTPCLSVFKPVSLNAPSAPVFTSSAESLNYWLNREYVLRAVYCGLIDYQSYRTAAKKLQAEFIYEYEHLDTKADLERWCASCARREQQFIDGFSAYAQQIKEGNYTASSSWRRRNATLGKGKVFSASLRERTEY